MGADRLALPRPPWTYDARSDALDLIATSIPTSGTHGFL